MNSAWVTLVLYLVVGMGIASALARSGRTGPQRLPVGVFLIHGLLWPLFVPSLLPEGPGGVGPSHSRLRTPEVARIEAAERGLRNALRELGRDMEDPLSIEAVRVRTLGESMRSTAARAAELGAALSRPENDLTLRAQELAAARERGADASVVTILEERLGHLQRMVALRQRSESELERAIARAEELTTRLALLRYEAPSGSEGNVERELHQLSGAIVDLCEALTDARSR